MLPSRSGRSRLRSALPAFVVVATLACTAHAGDKSKRAAKPKASPTAAGDLTSIPLPIGHEAKGLVLPNFDIEGHLIGKLEAASAKRIDQTNIVFTGLKLTTFTPENTTDLLVEMSDSVLDLKTRVIRSDHRTTIKRADFDIAGDKVEFDTVGRKGTITGNVKMVITGKNRIAAQKEDAGDE